LMRSAQQRVIGWEPFLGSHAYSPALTSFSAAPHESVGR
jgi:hypothetical protein